VMGKLTVGLDEAGRGALAGPIVAAALVYRGLATEKKILAKVKDSKLLTARQREKLSALINANFIFSIQALSNKYIDRLGIQKANVLVMEQCVLKLLPYLRQNSYVIKADYVGGAKKYLKTNLEIEFYKKGDRLHPEIAAASIIAKVYRDKLMQKYHRQYPAYNFKQHKGYGTAEHRRSIAKSGLCPWHRRSFLIRRFQGLTPLVA